MLSPRNDVIIWVELLTSINYEVVNHVLLKQKRNANIYSCTTIIIGKSKMMFKVIS